MTGCSIDSRANVHFRFGGLNQPTKKGACPRVWEEAIQSNCRLSRNIRAISLSLSRSACALGRVGVPRPGQLVRLNNNFIAYTHTDWGTPTHTHTDTLRVQVKSHQLVLCVKIGNISFISFIPPRTNEVVKCK